MTPITPSLAHANSTTATSHSSAVRAVSVSGVETPVLLYDGECGFCAGSVQFVLAHEREDRRDALLFAPLQGAFGTTLRTRYPQVGGVDSVVWYDPSRGDRGAIRVKSSAALAALAHVGGVWRVAAAIGMLVPRFIRDVVYDAIAKRRFELAAPACLIPTADTRTRFLA